MIPMTICLPGRETAVIREAVPGDAKGILDHLKTVSTETDFLSFEPDEVNLSLPPKQKEIGQFLQSPVSLLLAVEVRGRIVAGLSFRGEERRRLRHRGEIGITVERDYWELGIGRALIATMIEWVNAADWCRKINLRVREDNHRAIDIYRSFGFEVEGKVSREYRIGSRFYATLLMGLRIDVPAVGPGMDSAAPGDKFSGDPQPPHHGDGA